MLVGCSRSLEFAEAPAAWQHWPAAPAAAPASPAAATQLFNTLVYTMLKGRKPPILQVSITLVSPYLPLFLILSSGVSHLEASVNSHASKNNGRKPRKNFSG